MAGVIFRCASAAALTRSNVARSIISTMSLGSSAWARAAALSSTRKPTLSSMRHDMHETIMSPLDPRHAVASLA
jgi:hypothetical protein